MDEEYLACEWWDRIAPDRRIQIHRWVTQSKHGESQPIPGQIPLLDTEGKGKKT